MKYVNFGIAGVKVSQIALGLGFRGQSSADEAQRVIEHAIDSGINFLDCSNYYAPMDGRDPMVPLSEEILGRVLKTRRDEVVITSKVFAQVGRGPNDGGSSRYHIMEEVERSLRRLGTDRIDVYLLHAYDSDTPLEETLRALDDLVTSGKVRYAGCCNFAAWQVCNSLWTADRINAAPFICVQNPYSLINRSLEAEMFGLVRNQGLGVMVYSPLGVGLLSGAYTPGEAPRPGSLWSIKSRERYTASMSGHTSAILETVHAIAIERGKSQAQVALNWVISKPEVTVAISGNDTIEQLDDNLGAVGWALSEEEMERLDEVSSGSKMEFSNLETVEPLATP